MAANLARFQRAVSLACGIMPEEFAETTTTADALSADLNFRLSTMMFLQYAIWGAWLPLLFTFLFDHRGFSGEQIGWIFAAGAVGAIFAPFLAGQIADRYFNTEKYLAISHLIGGVLVWQMATLETYQGFLFFAVVYSLIYSPTLSLSNSLCFHHLPDRDRDFGRVRVWGTIGWICVGIGIAQWLKYVHTPTGDGVSEAQVMAAQAKGMADAFRVSALLGIVMGVYCFFLPHTPPSQGKQKSAVFEALGEIRTNPLLMLFLLAVPISCIHQFYFVHTQRFLLGYQTGAAGLIEWINEIFGVGGGGLMTVGQMSEILVLGAIPLVAKQVSRKTLLMVGIMAYTLRMVLFANVGAIENFAGIPAIFTLIAGVSLHGLCFGCFIFVAFMIVDEETTGDVRASAQSLFNLVTVGIGVIVGSLIATAVAEWAMVGDKLDYARLFSVPMWASLVCLIVLLLFYPGGKRRAVR